MIAILVLLHQNVGGMCPSHSLGSKTWIPIFQKKISTNQSRRSAYPALIGWKIDIPRNFALIGWKIWQMLYVINDGKVFFMCLEIQVYGFRNIKCLMKANNALIGWKGWHKPSHPPSPVFVNWDIFWLIRRSSRDFTYCKVSAEYVYLHLNIPFEKKIWLDSLLQEVCMGA